ncbi:hypothetical protein PAT3040_00277 [Paenibacillus agaridevorans]|uniref:SLH domain-containing protein n=2 Tax=Paenibacillus agaridevorans TaxID=171404 RepID=A0A2R5EGU7_9BACL|nr:hypothetical protein PAT3040_00277 [Paenibacillus agaridevorans]
MKTGDKITYTLDAYGLRDAYGYEFSLEFNKEVLQYDSFSPIAISGFSFVSNQAEIASGKLVLVSTKMGQGGGITGSASLAAITFTIKAEGTAVLKLVEAKIANSHAVSESAVLHLASQVVIGGGMAPPAGNTNLNGPINHSINHQPRKVEKRDWEYIQGGIQVGMLDGESKLALPVDISTRFDGHIVRIKKDSATLTLPKEVLEALGNLASWEQESYIEIQLKPVEENMPPVPSTNHSEKYRMVLPLMDCNLSLVLQDGTVKKLPSFPVPVVLSFSLNQNTDKDLLGIYHYNEQTRKWGYIRSTYYPAENEISASLFHFSPYTVMEYVKSFDDVPETNWVFRTLQILSAKYIVNGVTETAFHPTGSTTRAEFTAMLVRTLGLDSESISLPFDDVVEGVWYEKDIAAAYKAKLVNGVSVNRFAPNAKMTREEMAVLLLRAYQYKNPIQELSDETLLLSFKDRDEISNWAKKDVSRAIALGLMQGKGNGRFDPKSDAARSETAKAIYNLLMK